MENIISDIIEVSKNNEMESEIDLSFLDSPSIEKSEIITENTTEATTTEQPRIEENVLNSDALITIFDLIVSKGGALAVQIFAKKKVSSSQLSLTRTEIAKIKPICDRLYEKHLTGANIKDEYLLVIMLITIYFPAFAIAIESGTDIKKKEKKELDTVIEKKELGGKKKNYYKSKQLGYDVFE